MDGTATVTTLTTAVSTALSTVVSDTMSMIAAVLPYALSVMGAIIVVSFGIKVFRRITGR